MFSSFKQMRDALEAVLEKDIHAVIDAAPEPFVIRPPAQVIGPDQEIAAGRNPVGEIEGTIARAASVGKVFINRVIGREAGVDRQVTRDPYIRFRPAAAPAYFATVRGD